MAAKYGTASLSAARTRTCSRHTRCVRTRWWRQWQRIRRRRSARVRPKLQRPPELIALERVALERVVCAATAVRMCVVRMCVVRRCGAHSFRIRDRANERLAEDTPPRPGGCA